MTLKEVLPLTKSDGVSTTIYFDDRYENDAIEEPYDKYNDCKVVDISYTDYSDEYGRELTIIIERKCLTER